MDFKILDLFSGAGGFSCGLEMNENFKTLIASDFNKYALSTFKKNHNDTEIIYGDITDKHIKNKIIALSKEKNINMIIGGPPCQGFSNKGKKLGLADERNFLFLDYIEIVKEVNPEIFVVENVKNIISSADGYFINEIINRFSELNYNVSYKILNAVNFGVPQNRERAFIIGTKSITFDFNDLLNEAFDKVTVFDAISDLGYLQSNEGHDTSVYINPAVSEYQRLLRNTEDILYNHKATNHSKIALKKLSLIPPEKGKEHLPKSMIGNQKFKTTWGRLEWHNISPTIDTRFDTPSNGKNSHPFLNRAITPREAARLQSFPDSYQFLGLKTEICKQIGNAVPPFLAKALGKSIKRQFSCFSKKFKTDQFTIFNGNMEYVYNYLIENNIKVNHIITDPPYDISKNNNFSTMTSGKRQGIDFGNWDKDFDVTKWIKKYANLIDKNGSFIIFCSYRYISYIADELERNGFVVKDFIEWKKTNPMPRNIERRYVQDTEFAIWAVKEKAKWVFNKPKETPYLKSCFFTSTVSGKEKVNHPTQKSLTLMEHIIKIHSNENDIILDPFMGSGTTGVATLLNNRNFIGIELSEKYYELAKQRLTNLPI